MIISVDNAQLKRLRWLLSDAKVRQAEQAFVIEGKTPVADVLNRFPSRIEVLFVSHESTADWPSSAVVVADKVLQHCSTLAHGTEAMAIVSLPQGSLVEMLACPRPLVLLDAVQKPDNVGAILRSAAAFGVGGVLCGPGTADPFHPVSVRAMGGNVFQCPIAKVRLDDAVALKSRPWFCLAPQATRDFSEVEGSVLGWILGNEATGVSAQWQTALSTTSLRIPMDPGVDSLNVAVGAGIVFFEWFKNQSKLGIL
ncbi:MAG: TrmH family RNA methyltransferase [Candidatus Margulisiibacteriota bacterium]